MTARRPIGLSGLISLLICCAAPSAWAQMPGGMPGGGMGNPAAGPMATGPAMHMPETTPDVAPPALPGASGVGNISAGPVTTTDENPTKLLFSAINHGDYTQARAAVSRGANLNARNALDETPIELAVELNRNNITFMLLSVRAEEGPRGQPATTAAITPPAVPAMPRHPAIAMRARQTVRVQDAPSLPDQPGTPNPSAGFLGFGGHS